MLLCTRHAARGSRGDTVDTRVATWNSSEARASVLEGCFDMRTCSDILYMRDVVVYTSAFVAATLARQIREGAMQWRCARAVPDILTVKLATGHQLISIRPAPCTRAQRHGQAARRAGRRTAGRAPISRAWSASSACAYRQGSCRRPRASRRLVASPSCTRTRRRARVRSPRRCTC